MVFLIQEIIASLYRSNAPDRFRPQLSILMSNSRCSMETMSRRIETPFGSIENAQQYIRLLVAAVAEAKRDVDYDIIQATHRMLDRPVQALSSLVYNPATLHRYRFATCHTSNNLRSV